MRPKTILFAEDEELLRRVISRHLRQHGYRVLEAASGIDALNFGLRFPDPIHLLLTDIVMPDLNGRELAARLSVVRPQMKLLFISGYHKEADLEAGSNFLGKPFTPGELLLKVGKILGVQRFTREEVFRRAIARA